MINYKYKNYILIIAAAATAFLMYESVNALTTVTEALDHGAPIRVVAMPLAQIPDFLPALLFTLFVWKSDSKSSFCKMFAAALVAHIVVEAGFLYAIHYAYGGEVTVATTTWIRLALIAVSVYCILKPVPVTMKVLGVAMAACALLFVSPLTEGLDSGDPFTYIAYYLGNLLFFASAAFFSFTNTVPTAASYVPAPPVYATAADMLTALKAQYEAGAITEEAYLAQRNDIISKL